MKFKLNSLILTLYSFSSSFPGSRRKHLFSRDKLKLFLKQHCEPQDGVIKIKVIRTVKLFIGRKKKEKGSYYKVETLQKCYFKVFENSSLFIWSQFLVIFYLLNTIFAIARIARWLRYCTFFPLVKKINQDR